MENNHFYSCSKRSHLTCQELELDGNLWLLTGWLWSDYLVRKEEDIRNEFSLWMEMKDKSDVKHLKQLLGGTQIRFTLAINTLSWIFLFSLDSDLHTLAAKTRYVPNSHAACKCLSQRVWQGTNSEQSKAAVSYPLPWDCSFTNTSYMEVSTPVSACEFQLVCSWVVNWMMEQNQVKTDAFSFPGLLLV